MFSDTTILQAKQHAKDEYPKESIGFIINGEYVPLINCHEDPEHHFRVDSAVVARLYQDGGIDAMIHSHPDGELCPTKLDMERQIDSAVPWGIIQVTKDRGAIGPVFWGDQYPMAPLIGRTFVPGIHDCYALVRDWFKIEKDISLPIFPRDNFWWQTENIVADHLYEFGFRQIDKITNVGDCAIAPVLTKVENHCAVYVGNGLLLHHKPNRLSGHDPAPRWMKYFTRHFRHKDLF